MGNDSRDGKFLNLEAFKKILVITVGKEQRVLLGGRPYTSWACNDRISQRLAIVQLYKLGIATQEELSEAFGIHINSVYNYITAFAGDGINGLLSRQRGPKDPWKITPDTRFKILEVAFSNKNVSYDDLVKLVKEKWGKEVSIRSIYRVLSENGFISQPAKEQNHEPERCLFEIENKEQLLFRDLEKCSKNFSDIQNVLSGETSLRENPRSEEKHNKDKEAAAVEMPMAGRTVSFKDLGIKGLNHPGYLLQSAGDCSLGDI